MSYYPQFAELLNQQLTKLDRSPAWLARQLGVKSSTVNRWLNHGTRPGDPEIIVRVADILSMTSQRHRLLVAAGYGYQEQAEEIGNPPSRLTLPLPSSTLAQSNAQPRHNNLPQPLTPFVGRTAEIAQLAEQLLDPACHLLTLIGPGGIGKTRVGIEIARRISQTGSQFTDGLFFVPLSEVNTPEQLLVAIAEELQVSSDAWPEIRSQLLNFVHNKQLLLVLDNFEHLQAGAEVVGYLLANAPQVKVLVTSRSALGIPGEWLHPVAGLEVPAEHEIEPERLAANESACLFHQSAKQVYPGFNLAAEARHVQHICRLVDGIPLAIELAAAWLSVLPCVRIAKELEQNLELLASPLRYPSARHRSMQFVLEQSWQLLTERERDVVETLAIFQGGFDDAAAIEVANSDLITLATLAQKSMIRLERKHASVETRDARYTMHEVLRQFAGTLFGHRPAAKTDALARYSRYYLSWLQMQTPELLGPRQQVAVAAINADFENVRAAWQWAVGHGDFDTVGLALDGLYHFCEIRGRIHENEMFLEQAIEALQKHLAIGANGDPKLVQLMGKMQAQLGAVYIALIARKGATALLQQSLASVREPRVRAFALGHLGYALSLQGEDAEADALLHESLAISRSVDDLPGQAYGLLALSWVKRARGEYLQSTALGRESLAIYRVLGRPDRIARALIDLAVVEDWLGEYEVASDHLNESLIICRTFGYRHGEAQALNSLGEVAYSQGKNLEQAMALMVEALRIYQSTGHVSAVCFSLADLSWMATARGAHQQALQLGRDGVTMARSLQDDNLLANTLTALGVAQIGTSDLVGARRSLMEALAVARSHNNVFCMLLDLHYLAELLIHESRLNEDEHAQSQALEWLIFLQHHPACWQTNKEKAVRLEAEIVAALSAEQVAVARARGRMRRLDEVVSLILNQT